MLRIGSIPLAVMMALGSATITQARQELWTLDNLARIGGRPATPSGTPRVVSWAGGRAIEFDGKQDSILIKGRPLVGVPRFTVEAVIRADGGQVEQRFLHIAETDPATGLDVRPVGTNRDANHRIMFELRAQPDGYFIDAMFNSTAGKAVVVVPEKLHSYGQWHALAQTFDGKAYRTYVDGVLQGEMNASYAPHGAGTTRIGARMEGVSHFKGAIASLRFTDRALTPRELMTVAGRPVGATSGR